MVNIKREMIFGPVIVNTYSALALIVVTALLGLLFVIGIWYLVDDVVVVVVDSFNSVI